MAWAAFICHFRRINKFKLALYLVPAFIIQFILVLPVFAQAVTWTRTDIGNTGIAGSYSYTPGTPPVVQISGAGLGAQYVDDAYTYVGTPAAGACEIQARVASQTNTASGALAGLCMKNSVQASYGQEYILAVTPSSGLTFLRRNQGNGINTIATTAGAAPTYLRLTRSGDQTNGYTITASYGADGMNWSTLGSFLETNTTPMPNKFEIGFLVSSGVVGTLSTAVFDHVSYMVAEPQVASNLLLWLRSDTGVTYSSGVVSAWSDCSGNGLNATQTSPSNRPGLTLNAVNSGVLPTITMDGSTQYFNLPTGFSNLSAGGSIVSILRPSSSSATGTPFACGNSSNNDALLMRTVGTNAALYSYSGATSSNVTTSSNPLSTSDFRLVELYLEPGSSPGTATGKVYVNGALEATNTSLQNLANTSRANNFIGVEDGLANYFAGDICEILVYSSPLTESQRKNLRAYALSKYAVGSMPTLDAPTFTPGSGAVVLPQQKIVMNQSQNAPVFFTMDGVSTPTYDSLFFYNNSPLYLSNVGFTMFIPTVQRTTNIKARAIAPFFNDSPVTDGIFESDPSTNPIPRDGLIQWLRGSNVTTSGSNVTAWTDISGSLNDATNSSNQPTLVVGAVNELPAVNFNGSQFLQVPSGMKTFTSGLTAMLVTRPASVSAGARLFDYGNGATSDNIIMSLPSSTGLTFSTYNSSTSSSVTASSGATLGNFQLFEANYNGSNSANLLINAASAASSSSMQTLNNLVRNGNYISQDNSGSNRFNGQIAEMLLWNRQLTAAERSTVEGYLLSRYQLLSTNVVATPTFSVVSGTTFAEPSQVAIAAEDGAKIHVTVDGSTPNSLSPKYDKALMVIHSQTIKAIAIKNGVSSSVATASYTVSPSTLWPAPSSGDTRPLDIKQQLPNVAIPNDANQP